MAEKGGIPYLKKAELAESCGAIGLVVLSTGPEWPYQMNTIRGEVLKGQTGE